MIRTVVTFYGEQNRNVISEMLEKNGMTVRYRCRTGLETIRAIKKMGGGVVICGCKMPDMTVDQLAFELHGLALFLVVAKATELDLCENEELFKLKMPLRQGEFIGSVDMLIQMDQKRSITEVPKRSAEDDELIGQAKQILMEKNKFSEGQAHRYLQRRSMETCSKMTDTARLILRAFE